MSNGLEILEIPPSWHLKKLKYIARIDSSGAWGADTGDEENRRKVATTAQITRDGKWLLNEMSERYFSPEEIAYYQVKEGDIVVVKSSGSATNIISGKAGYVSKKEEGIIFSNFLMRVRPHLEQSHARFIYYLLTSYLTQERIKRMVSATTYPNLQVEEYISYLLPLPPPDEQSVIAGFLDAKTAKIDDIIAKKQKLIELLREERTAIINQAVTKGLDPNVKMKHSGVEWLGEIPAHWEVKRLKYVVSKIGSGITPKGGASVYLNDGVLLIRSQNVHFEGLRLDDVAYISEEIHQEMWNSRVLPGDLLLNITGASMGRSCFADDDLGEANVNQHVCIIRPSSIATRYLHFQMSCNLVQLQIDKEQNASNRQGLNFEQIANFILTIPDEAEQNSIVKFLDRESGKIQKTISRIDREIELLQEYRAALINEVVTGKVRVA